MLTDEQASKLRLMTQSSGWTDVFYPWMVQEGSVLIKMILDPTLPRPLGYEKMSDETATNVMRGEVKRAEYILLWVQNQLQAQSHNQKLEQQQENGSPVEVS